MQLPWKELGLERVLIVGQEGPVLFLSGERAAADEARGEGALRVAYERRDEAVSLRLLGRTLLPTLADHSLAGLYDYYAIEEGDSANRLFSLFSSLIAGFLRLSPDLLTLLAQILSPPHSDLMQSMVPLAHLEEEETGNVADLHQDVPRDLSLDVLLAPDGPLAADLPGFEPRAGQEEMARRVHSVLETGGTLIVEAGPGTGKTFSYLIPALIHLRDHEGGRIVLSTRTKQLQEQVFHKDIPFLTSHILPSAHVSLLKGRSNYICLRRWQIVISELIAGLDRELLTSLAPLARWLFTTNTGDIEENTAFLSDRRAAGLWRRLYDDPHRCLGQSCPLYDDCFSVAARRRARGSDLVVVNHSLLLADQQSDQGILGDYDCLIVDEAHAMETAARQAFTATLSVHTTDSLLRAIEHPLRNRNGGWLSRLPFARSDARVRKLHDLLATLRTANNGLFSTIAHGLPQGRGRSPDLSPFVELMGEVVRELGTLTRSIESLADAADTPEIVHEADGLISEGEEIMAVFDRIFSDPDENSVHWYEFVHDEVYLHSSPLSVAPFLQKSLYPRIASLVLTSATLSQRGDFTYLEESLGLSEAPVPIKSAVVASPFSYEDEMKLVIPGFLPPVTQAEEYAVALAEGAQRMARDVGRKILILFTSYRLLRAVHDALDDDVLVLAQGIDGPRSKLIEQFRGEDGPAILLGTDSFWEGVDLPGEALEILIITRLPFPVPSDPVFSALADSMSEGGKDPFYDLSIPRAILKLRQGVGRLIRTTADHGIVIITDQRIVSKNYGRLFIESLPVAAQRAGSLEDLIVLTRDWFNERGALAEHDQLSDVAN